MSHIWVIEILYDDKWEAFSASSTREAARKSLKHCKDWKMPDNKFRIRKYTREEKP